MVNKSEKLNITANKREICTKPAIDTSFRAITFDIL
jgi:hypothetical protein